MIWRLFERRKTAGWIAVDYPPSGENPENWLPWQRAESILPAVSGFSDNQSVAVFSSSQEGRLCKLGGRPLSVRKAQRISSNITANKMNREVYVMAQDKAFLTMPYRPELNWVRIAIAAACRRLGIELVSVDEQVAAGDIISAIHNHVRTSDLGYVVLTGLNPNVIYEMGLLHQAAKPTIILADSDTRLPFDVRSLMVLTYEGKGKDEARLIDQVAAATGQLLRFFDHAERTAIAGGAQPSATQVAREIGVSTF
jgi:hypothetical protein